jgi:hypothetical protein
MDSLKRSAGHVYVLTSPACEYIKIGGTDHAPIKRIQEINAGEKGRSRTVATTSGQWHR